MLYRTQQGYREEKNLSEGEKIARNFAFIVTIMDFSRRKKQERPGMRQQTVTPFRSYWTDRFLSWEMKISN